jgi:hypothetical protein
VSGQLESNHFLRTGDTVRRIDGKLGQVVDGLTLYAIVHWADGTREELEQFDPRVEVVLRGTVGG